MPSAKDKYEAIVAKHEALDEQIDLLKEARYEIERAEDKAAMGLHKEGQRPNILAAIETKALDVSPFNWPCDTQDNPTGMCVYDSKADPCHDECLYCGQPHERK